MNPINISLVLGRKRAYGRFFYRPCCGNSQFLIKFKKGGRSVFTEEEVEEMKKEGVVLQINDLMEGK
jgi:hypothetical protein